VTIDLVVRGICCLIAGVPGLSDNIRVRSIVGRNLEHSRIFYFANGGALDDDQPAEPDGSGEVADAGEAAPRRERFYIGSADLMPRNLDRRVEVLLRIDDPYSQERIRQLLRVNLDDTALAWEMQPDGRYRRLDGLVNAHDEFERLAAERAAATSAAEGLATGSPVLRRLPPNRSSEADDSAGAGTSGPADEVRAAGCMVYRVGAQGLEVLVAHRPHYDDWDFPKGKVEPGETDADCAIRETEEETGYRGELGPELPADRYQVDGRDKLVRWWLLRQTSGSFQPNEEVDAVEWLAPADAAARLSYPHARRLLGYLPQSLVRPPA
jgi:8-oxo-dGTP diphosphatase